MCVNIAVTLLAAQRAVLHENELTVCMWEIERESRVSPNVKWQCIEMKRNDIDNRLN